MESVDLRDCPQSSSSLDLRFPLRGLTNHCDPQVPDLKHSHTPAHTLPRSLSVTPGAEDQTGTSELWLALQKQT